MENQINQASADTPLSVETPEAVTQPEASNAPAEAVLVIPRAVFNYVVIAIVFFTLGAVISAAGMNAVFNANSAENQQLLDKAVDAFVDKAGTNVAAANQPQGLDPNLVYDVSSADQPSWGATDAPITLIEFSDYQCPFCERFHQETYPLLKQNFGDKIRFVYRDFPLFQIHPDAENAAYAANCAFEQDKYWDYHDMLFNNQSNLAITDLVSYADQLGMNADVFEQCLQTRKYAQQIAQDYQDGINLGVTGTPTFFINGRPIVGAQPYAVFADVINDELSKVQ